MAIEAVLESVGDLSIAGFGAFSALMAIVTGRRAGREAERGFVLDAESLLYALVSACALVFTVVGGE